ncbi:MAG: EVE domain-containing protein [Chloroflexi bacterium]|nr:EVE domain-containing protein [Chloroflexota bacterium]
MGSHIFLASKENFKRCLEHGLYGGIAHSFERTNSEIIAGFEAIRSSDFVFFYVRNDGIYGLWKATGRPFFDERQLWESKDQIYPYRVRFEPSIREFRKPIALSDVLDLRDKGKIWTFDLGTFTKKSHQPITTEEGKELIRLLLRNNPVFNPIKLIQKPYPATNVPLPLKIETDAKGRIKIEGYLNAWFMRSFAQSKLKSLIGEYYDFLNFVPTSFNTVMDIFLTHVTPVDGVEILHKFTCIELKTGTCIEEDLNQIIKYENWLVRKLAGGDGEMVQSVLVGFDFQDKVLEYVQKRRLIEEKVVRLLKYRVNTEATDIILQEVVFS